MVHFLCSTAEAKGSDCFEPFKVMQECMAQYPTLYGNDHKPEESDGSEDPKSEETESSEEVNNSKVAQKT